MGLDSVGKQELFPDLFTNATLFCYLSEQSCRIGEFQHANLNQQLIAIWTVLKGDHFGRYDIGCCKVKTLVDGSKGALVPHC